MAVDSVPTAMQQPAVVEHAEVLFPILRRVRLLCGLPLVSSWTFVNEDTLKLMLEAAGPDVAGDASNLRILDLQELKRLSRLCGLPRADSLQWLHAHSIMVPPPGQQRLVAHLTRMHRLSSPTLWRRGLWRRGRLSSKRALFYTM